MKAPAEAVIVDVESTPARVFAAEHLAMIALQAWRVGVGEILVLYDIDDKAKTVEILRIKHRRDIYRGL